MKKIFALLLAVSLAMGWAGCGGAEGKQSQVSDSSSQTGSNSAAPSSTPFPPTQSMKDHVISFAESFPHSFSSTSDLDPDDLRWFSFWKIWEAGQAPPQGDGTHFISRTQLADYVGSHFGIGDLADPPNALPLYQPDQQGYFFYPVGEGSMYDVEIGTSSIDQDLVSFDMTVAQRAMSASDPATEPVKHLRYLFQLQTETGGNQILRAIRAVPLE